MVDSTFEKTRKKSVYVFVKLCCHDVTLQGSLQNCKQWILCLRIYIKIKRNQSIRVGA